MVRAFFVWWLTRLGEFFPENWRGYGTRTRDALIVAAPRSADGGPDEVAVSQRRNGRETPVGRLRLASEPGGTAWSRLNGKPVVIRVAAAELLSKTLVLPLAAEPELAQVLAFEMDRETPFAADEVFWSHELLSRDRKAGQLHVRLSLIPKVALARLLEALLRLGVTPYAAETIGPAGAITRVSLQPGRGYDSPGERLRRPALIAVAGLASVAVVLPLARQYWTLAELESRIEAAHGGAAEADRLRREIDRAQGGADLAETAQRAGGRPLAVLDALTRLLPPDTYLTDLSQQAGKVTLTGRSAGASRLIGLLAQSDQLRNPAFAAPVTRMPATQTELFTITAEVAP